MFHSNQVKVKVKEWNYALDNRTLVIYQVERDSGKVQVESETEYFLSIISLLPAIKPHFMLVMNYHVKVKMKKWKWNWIISLTSYQVTFYVGKSWLSRLNPEIRFLSPIPIVVKEILLPATNLSQDKKLFLHNYKVIL